VLNTLDSVLVDIALKDETGNRLWKTHFLHRHRVSCAEFLKALGSALGLQLVPEDVRLRCLLALLAERSSESGISSRDESISADGFGKLVAWFGPLEPPMLDRIRSLLQQPWFHGHIEKADAESKLTGQARGAYLVRLSSTAPGCFTISKVGHHGISHQRIDYSAGKGFSCLMQSSDGATHETVMRGSLEDFVRQHAAELSLLQPIECSTWKHLFVTTSIEGYLNVHAED